MGIDQSDQTHRQAAPGFDPDRPVSEPFRQAVSAAISRFIDEQASALVEMGSELQPVSQMAAQLTAGGKRLRPAFCFWSYVAAAGPPTDQLASLVKAAASLDLLHVSALVHDDVMDSSDLRRGLPAAHRQFESLHAAAGWLGDSQVFGRAGAILLGDLLVMWSSQLLHEAGLDPLSLARALPILEAMRTEVTCGQYLDVVAQAHNLSLHGIELALDEANRVVEYKSARYTVQRPCQFGAALGGCGDQLHFALAEYGSPLGRAFQFRDDLLGVFGDPALTGKPTGDDLREGKRTVLIAHAYARTSQSGRNTLDALLGDATLDEAGVDELQQVISDSGAKDAVESMINSNLYQALAALDTVEMNDVGRTALVALAEAAVRRSS